jgi:Ca2+-transporting ATPase
VTSCISGGDIAPADGRILRSATLETAEAALTGESAPVSKDAGALGGPDVALGDRTNMVFQNTSVTGDHHGMPRPPWKQMGGSRDAVAGHATKSLLQSELDSLTKVLGIIAWSAVAVATPALALIPAADVLLLDRMAAPDPDRHACVRLRSPVARCEATRRCGRWSRT